MAGVKDMESQILSKKKNTKEIANTLDIFSSAMNEIKKSMKNVFNGGNGDKNQISREMDNYEKGL